MALTLSFACSGDDVNAEAGVGGNRQGCGEPGSHSYELSKHSCACEPGYSWCSDAIDEFECCPSQANQDTGESDTGEPASAPDSPCDDNSIEQLVCVVDPAVPEDPSQSAVWACNGERWVEVPGYATFACMARGYPFAYGCEAGDPEPSFACGYGPGSTCEPAGFSGVCKDEDIIDTCVWSLRTIDRCSRLCAELELFGPGYSTGACMQSGPDTPASCQCS